MYEACGAAASSEPARAREEHRACRGRALETELHHENTATSESDSCE